MRLFHIAEDVRIVSGCFIGLDHPSVHNLKLAIFYKMLYHSFFFLRASFIKPSEVGDVTNGIGVLLVRGQFLCDRSKDLLYLPLKIVVVGKEPASIHVRVRDYVHLCFARGLF